MAKIFVALILLVVVMCLVEAEDDAKEAGCSLKWGGDTGYCWKFCEGTKGRWCYTSSERNCSNDGDCKAGADTPCSKVDTCKSMAPPVEDAEPV